MVAKLFLDNIFTTASESPSSVKIRCYTSAYQTKGENMIELTGLMASDPSFSAQNKWGPVINDLSNLQDFGSLVQTENLASWVHASTMCWKGTSPLNLGIEFYLINYKKGLDLDVNLKKFVRLASLKAINGSKVKIHGGYIPDVLSSNDKKYYNGNISSVSELEGFNGSLTGNESSTIEVTFGHKTRIRNLLLSKVDVVESNVEVADADGKNRKPLYYRVSAQFTGVKPLMAEDVDGFFGIING